MPGKLYSALAWFDKAFGPTKPPLAHSMVQSQKKASREECRRHAKQAPMATVEMLLLMEEHLFDDTLNPVLACFAGLFIGLAIGCLRFSDLPRTLGDKFTFCADSLMGTCWRMKRKTKSVLFAIPLLGVSGQDWAKRWMDLL